MDYERFYKELEGKPAQDVTNCMQRVVSLARRRALADPVSFAKSDTPIQDAAILNADKVARELRHCQIARNLWTHLAVWVKFSAPGSPQPPLSELVKATAPLMSQPSVAQFIASVHVAIAKDVNSDSVAAIPNKVAPSTDRSSAGAFNGSEESKQSSNPMLISNPNSTMRDARLDGRRPGGVVYPPPLSVPNGTGTSEGHRGVWTSQLTTDQREIEQHKERINAIAEQNKLRRAAERQEGQPSFFRGNTAASRSTLTMPSAAQNGHRTPYGQNGFTSPPRGGYNSAGASSGYTNGHSSSNGYSGGNNGAPSGTYGSSNTNGKRPYDSASQPSYGRGGGRDGGRGGGRGGGRAGRY